MNFEKKSFSQKKNTRKYPVFCKTLESEKFLGIGRSNFKSWLTVLSVQIHKKMCINPYKKCV